MLHCPAIEPDVSNMTEPMEKSINARKEIEIILGLSSVAEIADQRVFEMGLR